MSPYLKWYPFVTIWPIGLNMLVTTDVPFGHGHNYAPTDYVRAWTEHDACLGQTEAELLHITEALGTGGRDKKW